VTRPLTFNNNNKQSNRDYTNSQHNHYNRDYNNYNRNTYNSNSNYQSGNQLNPHRAFQSTNNHFTSSNSSNHSSNYSNSLNSASGTVGARPLEANSTNIQFNAASAHQSTATGLTDQSTTNTQQLDHLSSDLNDDKSFTKWVPPSVTNRTEDQTQEDHNNTVFRKVRGILNKITPDKFNKLSDELLQCELDSPAILKGVVVLIFNKALEEPKYSSMYAQLCRKISEGVKNFEYDNPDYVKTGAHDNTFCKYLLAKCQHEFNNRCQASEAFGVGPLSDEDEERRDLAKKMMLGNIKFICELGKQNLADEGILHRCIVQLCKKKPNIKHTVEDFECLCQIMKTVGKLLDTERGKSLMDQYFSRMEKYANGSELPLRIKFKIQDVLDLRRNKWVPRTIQFDQNPKTLGQIREEATKDYSFLQLGGSFMANNQFPGSGVPLNVRGSSNYGQQQSVFQASGQRALDDMYGANLPTNFGSNSNSMNSSFEKQENSGNTGNVNSSGGMGANKQYGDGHYSNQNNNNPNNSSNYQSNAPPRRVIPNQPFNSNSNPRSTNKMNDMSSSSSNSSLRGDDEQLMNVRNQQHSFNNPRNDQQSNYNQGFKSNPNRPPQNENYHDSRSQMNNRYNQGYNNPNYPNRNNSGERMNNMNKHMGNMNLRDQNPNNNRTSELPPRFQKMQQQQQQSNHPPQMNQPNRNYNQQLQSQDYNNPHPNRQPNHYNNNGNNNYNNNPNNQYYNSNNPQPPNQYQQRPLNNNNYQNNPMNQPLMTHNPNKLINPIPNFNAMDSKDISLRPAKNFFTTKPPSLGQPGNNNPIAANRMINNPTDSSINESDRINQLNKPQIGPVKPFEKPTVASIQQKIEQQQKDQKEDYLNKVNETLNKLLAKEIDDKEALKRIKELKTTRVTKNQLLVHIMKFGLDKTEQEREQITKFVTGFREDGYCSVEDYVAAFKQILSAMRDLEGDVPKVKSFVAVYVAQALSDELIDLNQAFDLTVKTVYYPLFLLCLQYLGQNQDQQWLIKKFKDSKIDLMLALPEIDRNKERLSEVLRDRQLGFLYPLLRIESELMKQVNSGCDISPKQLYTWIKENVDSELQKSEGFIITLFTCIAKYVTEKTKDAVAEIEKEEGVNTDKLIIKLQKDILAKYAQIFQSFLLDHQNLQLALLYALQTYCHKLNFPKGMIFRWFIMLYDLEIVDGEVFLKWKEEVNEEYPDKGKALFQVNTWLIWLEKAEQDDDDDDEDEE